MNSDELLQYSEEHDILISPRGDVFYIEACRVENGVLHTKELGTLWLTPSEPR